MTRHAAIRLLVSGAVGIAVTVAFGVTALPLQPLRASAVTSGPAVAAAVVLPRDEPVPTLNSKLWKIKSKSNGQTYRVYISWPSAPPPPTGYPVFYMLDGDGYFGIGASQMRMRGGSDIRAGLIVAIGSASDDMRVIVPDRWRDFSPTGPAGDDVKSLLQSGYVIPAYGGAEAFHRFLVDELRPLIAAAYPIDATDQIIFGHSMGGLFVVHELFKHPTSFRTFIAASPSLYWGDNAVLRDEATFREAVASARIAPRVLLTVGGEESDPAKVPAPPQMTLSEIRIALNQKAMVDHVRELGARLAAVKGSAGYQVETIVFPGEGHLSVTAVAVSRGLAFALGKPQPIRNP